MKSSVRLACLASLWLVAACGGPQSSPTMRTEPFEPQDAELFDDTVDMVSEPQALGGRWQADWEKELEGRFARADRVVEGPVPTVRIDQDLGGQRTLRLVIEVAHTYKGEDSAKEYSLSVREGDPGFGNVDRNRSALLNKNAVAFIRYEQTEAGLNIHWHLSSRSDYLAGRLAELEGETRPSHIRVIQRTN